jgi:hypothetical protein
VCHLQKPYFILRNLKKGSEISQKNHQYSTDNENLQVQKNCCPDCRWKMEMNEVFRMKSHWCLQKNHFNFSWYANNT